MELEVSITNTSNLSPQKEEYYRLGASHPKLAIICYTFQERILLGWTHFNIHAGLFTISQQNADEFKCYIYVVGLLAEFRRTAIASVAAQYS